MGAYHRPPFPEGPLVHSITRLEERHVTDGATTLRCKEPRAVRVVFVLDLV